MPDEQTKVLAGWSMIFFAVINTIFNFSIVLREGLRGMRLLCVKWYRRFRRWLDPEFMRQKTKTGNKVEREKRRSGAAGSKKKVQFAP